MSSREQAGIEARRGAFFNSSAAPDSTPVDVGEGCVRHAGAEGEALWVAMSGHRQRWRFFFVEVQRSHLMRQGATCKGLYRPVDVSVF